MAALVAMDPISFPPPVINQARLQSAYVQMDDGTVVARYVIESLSGSYYEKGTRLKIAIYGEVCRGYRLEVLSTGGFRRTGELVAIKIIDRNTLNILRARNCSEDPMLEISCLAFIRDTPTQRNPTPPNRYRHVCYFHEACETEKYIFAVMEFIEGVELYDYIDEHGTMLPSEARQVFRQIVDGLSVLHSLGISHRDMSLENTMLSTQDGFRAVIIDFGQARRAHMSMDGTHAQFPPLGQAGKVAYVAPEVILNSSPFRGTEADVWSMGVMLFMLIAGHPPMKSAVELDGLYRRICLGMLPALIAHWGHPFSPECVDLVNSMLQQFGHNRATIHAISNHAWWSADNP